MRNAILRNRLKLSPLKLSKTACKKAFKFLSKQSPETNPPQFYMFSLLNWLLLVVIVINIVIGGLIEKKNELLMQLVRLQVPDYRLAILEFSCKTRISDSIKMSNRRFIIQHVKLLLLFIYLHLRSPNIKGSFRLLCCAAVSIFFNK